MKHAANESRKIEISPQKLNLTFGLPRFLSDILVMLFFLAIYTPEIIKRRLFQGTLRYDLPLRQLHILYLFLLFFAILLGSFILFLLIVLNYSRKRTIMVL
jgi:hypothetical protein